MADGARGGDLSSFHRHGPWVVAALALLGAIAVEAVRRHIVTREEALFFAVLIVTIILHEVSHGVVANLCGDDTAKRAGRLSLNPLRHIDPIGSVLLPILLIATTGSAFGWAKPVPVNVGRLRHPRNQAVLVGLAGPFVNVVLALGAGFAFRVLTHGATTIYGTPDQWPIGDELLFVAAEVNVIIAVFNLIPIPPLDGSAVVERLLPTALLPGYYRLRSASLVLVLVLVLALPNVLNSLFNNGLEIFWRDVIRI
ncbi:MAG TPA: site-2 protease family protein [Acidimicrobiales bacterium]|nr:site-2 protease family protein [Acidimicrobiales bacterium]